MKEYYVYELIDLSDRKNPKTFYVGKGIGSRVKNHAILVAHKIKHGETITDPKEQEIQNLLETKNIKPDCLGELVIGRYETESEALAVEATLIKWAHGQQNLTNKVHGHGSDQIREKGDYSLDNELQPVGYVASRKINIINRGIVERAQTLMKCLEPLGFENIFEKMFGEMEYGIYWPVPDFPVTVQIKMQESNNKVVLNARPSYQVIDPASTDLKLSSREKAENHQDFCKLLTLGGYIISAANIRQKSFAALFESTIINGSEIGRAEKIIIHKNTGNNISTRSSFHNGIESSNVQLIGIYLRDLQIRLTLAKTQLDLSSEVSIKHEVFNKLLRLFQSKPATKYSTKAGIHLFDISIP